GGTGGADRPREGGKSLRRGGAGGRGAVWRERFGCGARVFERRPGGGVRGDFSTFALRDHEPAGPRDQQAVGSGGGAGDVVGRAGGGAAQGHDGAGGHRSGAGGDRAAQLAVGRSDRGAGGRDLGLCHGGAGVDAGGGGGAASVAEQR